MIEFVVFFSAVVVDRIQRERDRARETQTGLSEMMLLTRKRFESHKNLLII